MSSVNSALNVVMLVGLCVAAFFFFTSPSVPVEPPNDAWFNAEVISRNEPVLVKFGADWCGPCRMMEPELDKLASETGGRLGVVRVDVGKKPALAQHYGVSSIPRLLLFYNGRVVADRVGYANEKQLEDWIASNVSD
jgi:thioredoxin 1